jgi:uncharacterized protein YqeY
MSLKDNVASDLKDALKSGDERRKTTLRLVLSAVHNAEIQAGKPLDDGGVLGVISKEAKQRRESIEEFRKGGRQDLVDREEAELAVLMQYLPQQMAREEIVEAARRVIGEVGAAGPGDKGKVMPVLIEQLRGRAEGRDINVVVTELLGNP